MSDPGAILFVFAGNNGSGKSTIRSMLIDKLGVSVNIDADALARGIDSVNPDRRKVSAGKEAIRLARECIQKQRDFSIETTLSGGNAIRQIQAAKQNGFEVTMFYVGLGNPHLNIERVAARVRNGGHHISSEDILRRHKTSMQNLLSILDLVDNLIVIDNSDLSGKVVLEAYDGKIQYQDPLCPDWVGPVITRLNANEDKS